MKVEGWLFAAGFFFFSLAAVVYWLLSGEVVGTVALAFTSGLAFLTGYYLLFTARRIDTRPEDLVDAEISDGAGELGFYSPHSWWPLFIALSASTTAVGMAMWLPWLIVGGVCLVLATVSGLVFEYYRGEPAL